MPTTESQTAAVIQARPSYKFRSISRGMCYLAMTLALIMQVSAQLRRDGEIVGFKPHAPLPPFDSLDNFGRSYFPRDLYEQARAQTEFQVLDMQYASDGLSVGGVLIRPKDPGSRRWPAIIYNRGGTGDFGRIDHLTIVNLGVASHCFRRRATRI